MFLNSIMLWGLAAIGVPILIHLLNRRKFQRITWAAMRFLKVSVEQNQRRIQIEDLLLLILRCALVALLALLLARPVLRRATALLGAPQVTAAVILDTSYSMSQTDGVQSRLAMARKAGEQIVRALPPGSSAAVFLCSDHIDEDRSIRTPTHDLTLAANALREAPISDRGTDLFEGVRAAVGLLKEQSVARKEIYLITDGQASGFQRLADIRRLLDENKRDIRAHIVFVGGGAERNLGVTALRADSGLAAVNQPVRLEVRVRNYGTAEATNVNVTLAVDYDPAMDQAVLSAIPPGEERSISLFARMKTDGYHTITAKIDADHLPADDSRSVALRAVKDVKVLLIDGDSGRDARDSEVFFLRAALRPVPRSQWDDYFIKLTIKLPTDLEAIRFEDFDAVITANVTDFSASAMTQLVNYVRNGGGLWVFPGDNINRAFYNEQLYRKHGLLPAMLGDPRGDAKAQEAFFTLSDKETAHDITSLWRDPASGALSSAHIFRAFDLVEEKPAPAGPAGSAKAPAMRIIARFADNRPALVERDFGQGRVVLFASTADTQWNDLPARAGLFVPLVHRTLGYLVARQNEHLTLKVGTAFAHTAPIEQTGKYATVLKRARAWSETAQNLNELEESRQIELIDGSPLLQFRKTDFAGPYEVKLADSVLVRFAAQNNPDESLLDPLKSDQRNVLEEVAQVLPWSPSADMGETLRESRSGSELWRPLGLLVLALASMETLLAHWFSKPK